MSINLYITKLIYFYIQSPVLQKKIVKLHLGICEHISNYFSHAFRVFAQNVIFAADLPLPSGLK